MVAVSVRHGLLVLIVIFSLTLPRIPSSAAAPPASDTRILIAADDRATQQRVQMQGGVRVVDYGAFGLWRVPVSSDTALYTAASDRLNTIYLRDNTLDTSTRLRTAPAQRSAGDQFWLIQFIGPIKGEWLDELEQLGLSIVVPMPTNAYVVWGDQAALERLDRWAATSALVQWSGPYKTQYRIAPELQALTPDAAVDVTVQFYTTSDIARSLARLQALSSNVYKHPAAVAQFTNISLQLPAAQIAAVARWPDVFNIESWSAPRLLDEAQGQLMAGNTTLAGDKVVPAGPGYLAWLQSKNFPTDPAAYPIVDVVDDGVDTGDPDDVQHPDFYELGDPTRPNRISASSNCTTDVRGNGVGGHGNLNAGIVAGYNDRAGTPYQDANGYHYGLGIAPYGRVASTKIFSNEGFYSISRCAGSEAGIVGASYAAGASITSDSWGAAQQGRYDAAAQSYDVLTRDASATTPGLQEMLHIFAAGNSGPNAQTINSPGTAKNVLTVGASEGVRDNGVLDGCLIGAADNADDMAEFSARGPTSDGRTKPDLVAPGTHIQGPATQDPAFNANGICGATGNTINKEPADYYPAGQTLYTWSSGTSHSTPAVAGAAALAYEYYGRVLRPGHTPSPAMLKALLLNSPRPLDGVAAGGTLPGSAQGWGSVDLGTLFDGTPRYVLDQSRMLTDTGAVVNITGTIQDATKPTRVSLVWTDAPGSTTGAAYVNDLDLEVTVGGITYRGNVFNGNASVAGGVADRVNNVEQVFLPAGHSGSFVVRVLAANIAGDGVPGNGDSTDQDWALVVSNGGDVQPTTALVVDDVRWNDAQPNGRIDPGEALDLFIDLRNGGDLTATQVTGRLTLLDGAATIPNATTTYANLPTTGAVQTNLTPLRVVVDAAQPCGTPLHFLYTVQYNGAQHLSYEFTLPIGVERAGPVQTYAAAIANPISIPDGDSSGITIPISVSAGGELANVTVSTYISHTWDSDLTISLIAPDGTEILLAQRRGGPGHGYGTPTIDTTFDDRASDSIAEGVPPFAGSYRPETPLDELRGTPLAGVWRLKISDPFKLDTGAVHRFALNLQEQRYVCGADAIVPTLWFPLVVR